MTEAVFYIFAAFSVLGAAMCVLQRSAVSSLVWLLTTMFSLAAIFVLLQAELLGVLQVLVYVGAILVLFLFVVMLLNVDALQRYSRGAVSTGAAVAIGGLLLIELIALWKYTPSRLASELAQSPQMASDFALAFPAASANAEAVASRGIVGAVAAPMFQTYLVPFEITSILLLAALVGAVVLAKKRL